MLAKKMLTVGAIALGLGFAGKAEAALLESLQNPIADGAITIDGNVDDWAGVTGYAADLAGDGVAGYDIKQLFIAHDSDHFYVRVSLHSADFDFDGSGAGLWTLFDTDKNPSTGLAGYFASDLGTDFNGSGISQFNEWVNGAAVAQHFGGSVTAARSADSLYYEYSIERSLFGVDSFYVAVQSEFGQGDLAPAGAGNYYEYNAIPEPASLVLMGAGGLLLVRRRQA